MINSIESFVSSLIDNKIILYPTDTIWGIWWDATNQEIINRIINLKWLKDWRLWFVMLAHPRFLWNYVDFDEQVLLQKLSIIGWPVTFRFYNPTNIPEFMVTMWNNTATFRIPYQNDFLMKTLEQFGKPIISTSANFTGMLSPKSYQDIVQEIKTWVDDIIDPIFDTWTWKASTIIDYETGHIFR
jgi:L-threonylcarbamoyladenylate synthase